VTSSSIVLVKKKKSCSTAFCGAEDLRIGDKAHVGRNVVVADFLGAHASHGPCTVANENAVPTPGVCVRQRAQQALIGVDTRKEESLLPALTQPLVHGQLGAPKPAHACFVEANVVVGDILLERIVDVCVPCAREQATLAALLFWKFGAQTDVPSTALLVCHAFVEATGDGGRHDLEVMVGDAPVQPADLDALGPALLENFDERLHGRDALAVVVEVWVDKVVLHVDDDEQSALRVDQNAAVVADAIVGVESDLALAAAGQIEALGLGVVEPLVVAAWVWRQ
jgi:hypothetical protein